MNTTLAMLMSGGLAGAALAQDLAPKPGPQPSPIAIVNATVHPVSGPAIEGGHVVFDAGVITHVGQGAYVPEGPATVIDASGLHVYPGLIGAVTQLGLNEIASIRATLDYSETGSFTPEARAIVAINPDSTLLPVTRANGVLAAGIFPNSGGRVPGRAGVAQLDGWTWEDMAVDPDAGLVLNWPFMRSVSAPWLERGEDEQNQDLRRSLDEIDEFFDAASAYAASRDADPRTPIDVRLEAVRPTLAGSPLFIDANDADQIEAAVVWAAGRGLKPVILGGRDAMLCVDLLKEHDVPVIVSGVFTFPKRADAPHDDAYTLPARLQAAGVRWCFASGEETPHERNLPYNAAKAVGFGLDHDAAIRALTLSSAEILGVANRLGSLEADKDATLLVTDGSPLEITTRIERAFIRGRAVDLGSKHSDLAKKYREKYRQQAEESGSKPR